MASLDLMVKVLNPTIRQPEEIFSRAISRSSPRWLMVVSGSATNPAELAFCRMAASRISHRTKDSPQAVFTHLRRTLKARCGPRLPMGWNALKVLNGTALGPMEVTRKSIPTMFLSIAEERFGPTREWG